MSVGVTWLSIFADVPAGRLPTAQQFWEQVTATSAGPPAGARREYLPLVPETGDRYLWLQRLDEGPGGWHPDLHVLHVGRAVEWATRCGAEVARRAPELVVLATPAGQPFCLVADGLAERRRPSPPSWHGKESLADQLCLDIPAQSYDTETDFWAALTGWPQGPPGDHEFRRLNPPGHLPVQFLLQRLGPEDRGGARAHLDLSADDPPAEVARHESLGARVVRVADGWTTMEDPAGLIYCVTHRRPGEPAR